MSRKKIVAGNWKMNKNIQESIALSEEIMSNLASIGNINCEVIVAPTSLALQSVFDTTKASMVSVSAQNVHNEDSGAFTGEISPSMLKDLGVKYCIIGHSERRSIFEEKDSFLASKVTSCIKHGITPIFCVGENLEQRNSNTHEITVNEQLLNGVFHLSENDFNKIIIAYEPVWAIGTGKTASKEQANEMHSYIRQVVAAKYNNSSADQMSILYGGSVKPENSKDLFAQEHIDGGLIGGAALNADNFINIIKSI